MANFGKIIIPLGIVLAIVGGIIGPNYVVGLIPMIIGIVMIVVGLPRVVQGKDRKIMGKIVRPKAAARSSAIWSLWIFNAMPLYLPGSRIMNYTPPQPLAIWISGYWQRTNLGYSWVPFVVITYFIIFFVGLLLSGKYPKVINILFNFIITVCLSFFLNFGVQLWLWTFFLDQTDVSFFQMMGDMGSNFIFTISFSLGVAILSIILIVRMIKQLGISFSNLEVQGGKKTFLFTAMILTYVLTAAPLYFGISMCLENNAYSYNYIQYVGIVFVVIPLIIIVTTLINNIRNFAREQQGKGKNIQSASFGMSTAIFLVVLFLSWAPLFMPLVDHGENSKNNSIYNTDWNGWSNFKRQLAEEEGYNVMSIQSSISTISQLDPTKQVILVIPGSNVFYNPASEVPYFLTAFKTNFSMFICDDHGTTETLLFETFIASLGQSPITFLPKGILRDNSSYWKTSAFPVITQFNPSPLTTGVDSVCLNYATGFLGGDLLAGLGWDIIGTTSGDYSFIDVDDDGEFDQTIDKYSFPSAITGLLQDQEGGAGLFGDILDIGIPLGGYPQAVFSTKEVAAPGTTLDSGNGTYSSRLFCATDASWLNNELTDEALGFDNLQFGLNVMDWLTCERDHSDTIIVFDEAHIRPENGATEISSAAAFGTVQGYVNWLSTNPILGLVYPIFALYSLRKWIPKEGDKKDLQLKDLVEAERNAAILKFRTSSFFAQKINWYRKNKKYRQALIQLYRRLERKVNRMLGDAGERGLQAIMAAIRKERGQYISKENLKRLEKFFDRMLEIKQGKSDVSNEEEFEDLFLEMSWANDALGGR